MRNPVRPFRHGGPVFALALCLATSAGAADVWTTPFPGVKLLHRTTTAPALDAWVAQIDTCAAGISFRVATPGETGRTTSSFATLVGAAVATNGDFADGAFGMNMGAGQLWSTPDTDHSGNFIWGPGRIEVSPHYALLPGPPVWANQMLGGRWTLLDDGAQGEG